MLPALVFGQFRQFERDRFGCGIQHDENRRLPGLNRPQHVSEKPALRKIPVLLLHLFGRRRQPQDAVGSIVAPSIEPATRTQLRKALSYFGHLAGEIDQVVAFAIEAFPVDPACFVILAIGVVVAGLRVGDFVAGQDQRHALRQQEARELVSSQLAAKRCYGRVVGRAFMAAIGAVVFVGAVAIVFEIGLVVLFVVAE